MNAHTLALAASLALLASTGLSSAEESPTPVDFDAAVGHFAEIGDTLAHDSTEGVAEAAVALLAALDLGAAGDTEAVEAARALAAPDLDLAAARAAYKELSAAFVPLASGRLGTTADESRWAIMTCPMAGASWIQADGPLANPYYGSAMFSCGSRVSGLGGSDADPTDGDDAGG